MRALVLTAQNGDVRIAIEEIPEPQGGDVTVRVEASSLNYKDWLVSQPASRVRRVDRLTLGVEAAGRVVASSAPAINVGDDVMVYGGPMGVGADGGFAEFVSVPARYVTVLATPLNARRAIIFGLAGYTAVASILALEARGAVPGNGEILVTGATGGVGSLAVALLARRGHSVVASTGSAHHREWLTQLGASEVIGRDEIADRPDRVLGTERWAGAVDCVGGNTLTQILRSLRYGAAVAASGLVAGADLATTIYPFITRGVALLGVDAVETTSEQRSAVWDELARLSRRDDEQLVERTIALTEVAEGLSVIGAGATHGRWLVELNR